MQFRLRNHSIASGRQTDWEANSATSRPGSENPPKVKAHQKYGPLRYRCRLSIRGAAGRAVSPELRIGERVRVDFEVYESRLDKNESGIVLKSGT